MLECSACLQACFRAVAGTHAPTLTRTARRHLQTSSALLQYENNKQRRDRGNFRKDGGSDKIYHERPKSNADLKAATRRGLQNLSKPALKSTTGKKVNVEDMATEQALKYELRFLQDPLKLAEHVKYTLDSGKEDRALALVQLSSRSVANVVAWNHVLNYLLAKSKTAKALTAYNDMKKRGLQPDSYTYTILLRGLADNAHQPAALGRALALYHALHAPKSKAAPNIIHTNCVLKVCSRAGDTDSMWDIISKLPNKGAHAANGRTYVLLLNTIRYKALQAIESVSGEDTAQILEEAIIEGRQLWLNIVTRWRNADIAMEEQLVCSMARLLLIGQRPRDWDDVLSLVQQTMGITRLVPRLGTMARREQAPYVKKALSSREVDQRLDPRDPEARKRRSQEFHSEVPAVAEDGSDAFALAPTSAGSGKSMTGLFVKPGNNILSVIVEACHKMMLKDVGAEYWSLLTDPTVYGVTPDQDNFSTRLRLLRQTRSSAQSLEVLRDDMPAAGVQPLPKTYRIAISTCYRDILNPNAFETASGMVDVMMRNISSGRERGAPYPGVLEIYVEIARKFFLDHIRKYEVEQKTSTSWGQLAAAKDDKAARNAVDGGVQVLSAAITRLEVACKYLRKSMLFGDAGSKLEHRHERDQMHKVFQQTASFCGTCLVSGVLDQSHSTQIRALQAQLDRDMKRLDVRSELKSEKVDDAPWQEKKSLYAD